MGKTGVSLRVAVTFQSSVFLQVTVFCWGVVGFCFFVCFFFGTLNTSVPIHSCYDMYIYI